MDTDPLLRDDQQAKKNQHRAHEEEEDGDHRYQRNSSISIGESAAAVAKSRAKTFGWSQLETKERGTTVWYDELDSTREAFYEANTIKQTAKRRKFENHLTPHIFTAEERKRMDSYQSIDYWQPQSFVYQETLKHRGEQHRWFKWVIFIVIGICVGLWAVMLFQSIELLADLKDDVVEGVIKNARGKNPNGSIKPLTNGPILSGYFFWMLWSVLTAVLASLFCVLMPSAAGSGIPDVMAYLNGIMFPRVFNIRTLLVKTLSCICAISSGLPVGAEGPIIHIGALIGAGISTGRSRTMKWGDASFLTRIFAPFRNTKDHRDFISGGAAAGVTGAFGSPIGGLLFVMEEMASFFPAKLAWMVFFSCLACVTALHFCNSYLSGWKPRNRSGIPFGNFVDSVTTLFDTRTTPEDTIPMNVFTLLPSIVAGIYFAGLAVFFALLNIKILRWRNRVVNKSAARRVLEPLCVIFVFGSLSYLLPLAFDCQTIPVQFQTKEEDEHARIRFIGAYCDDPETQYNPLATLTLTSAYNAIRLMYTRNAPGLFPWSALVVYEVLYTVGASWSGGMFLSSGLVIPTLVVGSIGGRLIGQIFGSPAWADPGVIALIGSAAFFGGLARLTFSLTVIMLEVSGDLTHIVCIMVAVVISKTIADKVCHSLYHMQLEVKCAPFLDVSNLIHTLDVWSAKDIMSAGERSNSSRIQQQNTNSHKKKKGGGILAKATHVEEVEEEDIAGVVTFATTEKVLRLMEVLRTTTHSAFPVVSVSDGKTFRGLILRSQIEELLWYTSLQLEKEGIKPENLSLPVFNDLQKVKEEIFWKRLPSLPEHLPPSVVHCNIDLNNYYDASAFFVHEAMCLSRTYNMFRQLGLRHLVVLNRHNHVVGIITRTNLIGDRLNERLADAAIRSGISYQQQLEFSGGGEEGGQDEDEDEDAEQQDVASIGREGSDRHSVEKGGRPRGEFLPPLSSGSEVSPPRSSQAKKDAPNHADEELTPKHLG